MLSPDLANYFRQIHLPSPASHKGQNGKLLIIGGSELFHAAGKWSLDIASKCVDMVFYASVPSNNQLIQAAKGEFWNGIVIDREQIEAYIEEASCVLIGPGMERSGETQATTNYLLAHYPTKKWVIDAGALQMLDVSLLQPSMILTPHAKELAGLLSKFASSKIEALIATGVVILLKGQHDTIYQGQTVIEVPGGNAGMTKGGTGDVLAGLVAGLYATSEALPSTVVASLVNKAAGDELYQQVGPFYNASELVETIPRVLWRVLDRK